MNQSQLEKIAKAVLLAMSDPMSDPPTKGKHIDELHSLTGVDKGEIEAVIDMLKPKWEVSPVG
jgi:hypothetical protein